MQNKKTERFFEEIEKKGLDRAFNKMSDISYDTMECYLEDLIDDFNFERERPECRIRFDENWHGEGEHYVFEIRQNEEEDWSFASAFPLATYENGELVCGKGDMIHYTALTKIRELIKMDYKICFI